MRRLLVPFLLLAASARAATYVVGDDRALVAASEVIVAGAVIDSYARVASNGLLETVTEVLVEETIRGDGTQRLLRVVQWGGRVGDRWMVVPGAPRYARGERVLLFLDRAGDAFTTHGLALGSFRFAEEDGAAVLRRSAEITGWDADGAPHVERPRLAKPFLDFVRAAARGESPDSAYVAAPHARRAETHATYASGSYALRFDEDASAPIRRFASDLRVDWRISGTQGGLDFAEAVDFAVAKWNAQSGLIEFSRSAAPATGDTLAEDGESRIIAGDPHHDVPGVCCGGGSIIAAAFVSGSTDAKASFNGESFFRIESADVIFNEGVSVTSLGQGRFNTTMAHELGHTLGLRHSDEGNVGGPCVGAMECCSGSCAAVMRSAITSPLLSLQSWDRNAVDCLYDGVCTHTTACLPPAIASQPQSRTIAPGEAASLTVAASGTPPFTYRWYAGLTGDASDPIGGNTATLSVSPAVTTSYWVRVTGQCAPPVNSRTAIVTVAPRCTPPAFTSQPQSRTVRTGESARLSVAVEGEGPFAYFWFEGEVGDFGRVVGGNAAELVTAPLFRDTRFWVRATNGCGSVNSVAAAVTVVPGKRRAVH